MYTSNAITGGRDYKSYSFRSVYFRNGFGGISLILNKIMYHKVEAALRKLIKTLLIVFFDLTLKGLFFLF